MLLLSSVRMGINLGLIDDLVDRHRQRALHPDPAGVPPEDPRVRARSRGAERRPRVVPPEQAVQRPAGPAPPPLTNRKSATATREASTCRFSASRSIRTKCSASAAQATSSGDPRGLQAKGQAISSRCRRRGVVVPHPGAGLRDAQLGARRPGLARRGSRSISPLRRVPDPSARVNRSMREFMTPECLRPVSSASSSSVCAIFGTMPSISGSPNARPIEDRFLSCNLNISWPDQGAAEQAETIRDQASILSTLHDVFDHMIITTRVVTSRSREDDRPLCRLAVLLQLRPRLEIRQHTSRALAGPRARLETVVSRPIHSARLAVNPSRAWQRIGGISSSGTNRLSASVPP